MGALVPSAPSSSFSLLSFLISTISYLLFRYFIHILPLSFHLRSSSLFAPFLPLSRSLSLFALPLPLLLLVLFSLLSLFFFMSRLLGSSTRSLQYLAGLIGASFLLDASMYNVDAGHRAILFNRFSGIQNNVIGEGTHFLTPILQKAYVMDVRIVPRTISTVTGTKDLQTVNLQLRVLTRPLESSLPTIFRTYGLDYNERILPSICNEVLKAVVALYDADELLTLRDQVSTQIRDQLSLRAKEFNIHLDDVSLTHLHFSKDFTKAIEDKQVAEQMAERAKFIVARSEQEQQALIIRSEGDAEAARLVSDALEKAGKGLIELRRIETAIHIADTLQSNPGITFLPTAGGAGQGGNGTGLLLNIQK